ncbi:hypothetical protein TPHA_0B00240 [Tetrapisispora phaffii CBS 4417]|uniref:non-specific serine/threonine protein kinase n=1 Tax=Tetrapisispora phaffii (strain ATCC 24235 / CBS 4417 / NBRC 1672 / NRRL Y-8282 / UCD 70-5) TaxID=1071381 RepID=G8BQ99_TETPH|nr:hypothetical protein TPHA_0B00240 [Tetrapisispora phaffii CBS 4417]CCE61696.1 hypothetical protein TPHA_0B00240 [Tetrapisispora phaffii CBS 4417]
MSEVQIAPELLSGSSTGNVTPTSGSDSTDRLVTRSGLSRLFNNGNSPNLLNIRYQANEICDSEEERDGLPRYDSASYEMSIVDSETDPSTTSNINQLSSNENFTKGILKVNVSGISHYNVSSHANSLKMLISYDDVSMSSYGRKSSNIEQAFSSSDTNENTTSNRFGTWRENESNNNFNTNEYLSPIEWSTTIVFDVTNDNSNVHISLYNGLQEDRLIGNASFIPETKYLTTNIIRGWYTLTGGESSERGDENGEGKYRLYVEYDYQVEHGKKFVPENFELLKLLGKGTFGRVYQVEKKDTGKLYAMKVISKSHIIKKNEIGHTLNERNILVKNVINSCPFIVNLKYSFQTNENLYLVTDFKSGGELFMHLQYCGTFEESRSRFYAAELVLALEYLHDNDIIYRDLKPENVLLDASGNISLCDFGLSKLDIKGKTRTFCGTTEYLAPEILTEKSGYTHMVDFWGLGILMFEMCCGWSPFKAPTIQLVYNNIVFSKIKFPKCNLSQDGRNFIKQLLNRKPDHRLGSNDGARELKKHPFFKDIDWVAMLKKEIEPPFIPILNSDKDTAYFDKEFTKIPKEKLSSHSNYYDNELSNSMQNCFSGFTFEEDSILSTNKKQQWIPAAFPEDSDLLMKDVNIETRVSATQEWRTNRLDTTFEPLDLHDNGNNKYIPLNPSLLRYEGIDSRE